MIHHVTPIPVLHLFPLLDQKLIELLRGLRMEEWEQPTIASRWRVRDIAAHLLDGNLRTLSIIRDNYFGSKPAEVKSYVDMVHYLNQLNEEWVSASGRLSPRALTDLLESTGKECFNTFTALDPWADAVLSVAWAGEEISRNWFHIAREYTEKWVHQQQIREALNRPGIMTRELFFPFIDTFMCALPQTYKHVEAVSGTSVKVVVTSELGGEWHVNKTDEGWVLRHQTRVTPNAVVEIDPDTAWKLFSKGPADALEKDATITGAEELGLIALNMVSVMA